MATQFNWVCPFCQHSQVVTGANRDIGFVHLDVGTSSFGYEVGLVTISTRCSNPDCLEMTLAVEIRKSISSNNYGRTSQGFALEKWSLRPTSTSKPQPDYIPQALRADYLEACKIRDLSPKASATLSRRCIQGMIRDFCGISKPTLAKEIGTLKECVDAGNAPKGVEAETMDAIDAVRSIGNIGAHMEADINVIIDVEQGEAQALIELIELLFEDWYVARYKRQQRLSKITAIADDKRAQKKAAGAPQEAPVSDGTVTVASGQD